ncbi:MAG TPA: polysaccharide biosynthesis/export family protein [Kofleriaceae bacterium]|nr:polysaccharide biosynthesis/export family protein [Kofleriaceae bacterium]
MTATTRTLSLVALMAALVAACGARPPDYDYSKEPNPRRAEFVIGVSDELLVTVWRKPELTTTATVRPDGTITMPLIGDVVAANKTPSQLKQEVQRRIAEFIKLDESTTISIAITGVNSYRFTVSGEVGQPGIHTSKVYVTVAEAIALAGGFTRFAKRDDIVLMRRNQAGVIRRIPIAYSLIANGDYPEMNLVVLAGDSIFVP